MKNLLFGSLALIIVSILLSSCSDEQGSGSTSIRELTGGSNGSGYTIEIYSSNGTVTKSPDKTSYNAGDTVTLTATPANGYKFSSWGGFASGTNTTTKVIMNSNLNVIANFRSLSTPTYLLTINASNGTVTKSPDKTAYDSGDVVTLKAHPKSGYTFISWSGSITGDNETISIVMDGDKNMTAVIKALAPSTPTITLTGGDTVIIAQNDPNHILSNLGASATDSVYGNLTDSIIILGSVYTSKCTTFVLIYSVTNPVQTKTYKNRTVIVDCSPPELTLLGSNPDSFTVGTAYVDPGAMAADNIDGTITSITRTPVTINTSQAGTDTVIYSVSDRAGNKSTARRVVVVYVPAVIDSIAPVITLNGSSSMSVSLNGVYTEPGAAATDNIDGTISNKIVVTGTVNTVVAGTYYIYYNVSDKAGNAAITKTRTITVTNTTGPDVTPPVITLKGKSMDSVKVGTGTYADPGWTATDDRDGDLTAKVVVTDLYGSPITISLSTPGVYTLEYSVSDKAGNKGTTTRVVYVVGISTDKTPPVISLTGAASCTLIVGNRFVDPGYSASDDVDGIITNKVLRTFKSSSAAAVDSNTFFMTVGQYTVTYSVSDAAGNPATAPVRNVLVEDIAGFGKNQLTKIEKP